MLEMKIFRKVAEPLTYKVVGHDGPHPITPGVLNSFQTDIAVQPGDVVGLNDQNASTVPNACDFSVPGEVSPLERAGDLADGAGGDWVANGDPDYRMNVTAVVALKPSNTYGFGKVKDHKHNGTATIAVKVPGPGTLSLTGKGIKTQRTGGAVASKAVTAAGTVKLPVKPKGKTKRKLSKRGKAKVKVTVTYTPHGDIVGDPNTQTKRVKLIKKH